MTKLVIDGIAMPEASLPGIGFSVRENRLDYTLIVSGRPVTISFAIAVDPRQAPHSLDAKLLTGEFQGKTCLGRIEVAGDRLTVCLPDQPGGARPKAFDSKPGSGLHLITLKRR